MLRTLIRARFCSARGFLFVLRSIEKKTTKHAFIFEFLQNRNYNFTRVCVLLFLLLYVILFRYCGMNSIRSFGAFCCFSYTTACEEETNMAVESVMTCKIGLIWRHTILSMLRSSFHSCLCRGAHLDRGKIKYFPVESSVRNLNLKKKKKKKEKKGGKNYLRGNAKNEILCLKWNPLYALKC